MSDSIEPTVLTVGPDGSIGANFTGHIHAAGLDLDLAGNATPPDTDKIRWLRSDGSGPVELAGYEFAGALTALYNAIAGVGGSSQIGLQAKVPSAGVHGAQLIVQGNDSTDSLAAVYVGAGLFGNKILIDGLGESSYLQLSSLRKELDYGLVAALPGAPNDGDRCHYYNATYGVMWSLVYRASDGYWYKVGGAPLFAEVSTDQPITGALSTYQDLATAGPSIVNPLAGDYRCCAGCFLYVTTGGTTVKMGIKIGGGATSDFIQTDVVPTATNYGQEPSRCSANLLLGLGSNTTIKAQYWTNQNTAHFRDRWLEIDPVRVK